MIGISFRVAKESLEMTHQFSLAIRKLMSNRN